MYKIKIKTYNKNYMYQNTVLLKESIQYPFIENETKFNQYYQNIVNGIKTKNKQYYQETISVYVYQKQKSIAFQPYEITLRTTITLNTPPYVSLYLDHYEYFGGAHGITNRKSNTWDLRTNQQINLRDLFQPGYKKIILSKIKEQAHQKELAKEVEYFSNLDQNIVHHFDEKNYYLDKNNVVIFYPLYTIAPYYVGIQEFRIPFS